MSSSPLGYVLEGDIDKAKFERHVAFIRPISSTIINNHQYALHLKRNVIPATEIYIRNVDADGDGNDSTQYTPQNYFDKYAPLLGDKALGLQFGNEGDFGPEAAAKLIPFMQEAVKRKIKLSLPGVAVGNTPSAANGWAMYHEFVDYACHHRDYIAVDLHEYFLALPTSGMITAQTQPGDVLYFTHALRSPEQWENKSLPDFTNFYHVGRCGHLFTYAKSKGWPAPVVDLGEFGSDFVKDNPTIEQWARKIIPSNGAANIDGFRSLYDYWRNQFPKTSPSETFFKMLQWLWEKILQPLGVRSARLFEWNDGSRWQNFNVAAEPSLQLWLESFPLTPPKAPAPPALPPAPVLPAFPFDFDIRAEEGIAEAEEGHFNVRTKPSLVAPTLTNFVGPVKLLYIPAEKLRPEERLLSGANGTIAPWLPVYKAGVGGGWVFAGSVTFKPVPPLANAALIAAYELALFNTQATAERLGRMALELATIRDDLAKDLELLRAVGPFIKELSK